MRRARRRRDVGDGSLAAARCYDYARVASTSRAHWPGAASSYAAPFLATCERVVVRHNRHGGMLAPITRDLFRSPTRAPHELAIVGTTARAGVPTPRMLGYVTVRRRVGGFDARRHDARGRRTGFDLSVALMSSTLRYRARALAPRRRPASSTLRSVGARTSRSQRQERAAADRCRRTRGDGPRRRSRDVRASGES